MKKAIIGALLFCAVTVTGHAEATSAPVTLANAVDTGTPLRVTPVWWAGAGTICHHGFYGIYGHPAYGRVWVPGHHSWNGFWIPGHWA